MLGVCGGHFGACWICGLHDLQWRNLRRVWLIELLQLRGWLVLWRRRDQLLVMRGRNLRCRRFLVLHHLFRWNLRGDWFWCVQSVCPWKVRCCGQGLMRQLRRWQFVWSGRRGLHDLFCGYLRRER